jgi:hypothetical protein
MLRAGDKGNLQNFQSAVDFINFICGHKRKRQSAKCQILTEISVAGLESLDAQL